ncbi:hypothetical protein Tco_0172193 [Tanacetum coccineum]
MHVAHLLPHVSDKAKEPLLAGPDVHGQSLAALPSQSAASENGSQIPGLLTQSYRVVPCHSSSIGLVVELPPASYLDPIANKQDLLRGGILNSGILSLRSIDDCGNEGDGCTGGSVSLARRSPADGGDNEVSGESGGVGKARSLSKSAVDERDTSA